MNKKIILGNLNDEKPSWFIHLFLNWGNFGILDDENYIRIK